MRAVLSRNMSEPFVWGESDCSFVFDAIRDMTGFDAIEQMRGYSSERTALAAVRRAGFESILEVVEAAFEEIDPALAMRGDIGYPADIPHPLMSPALIDGSQAFSKQPSGVVVINRSAIVRAWAV